MLPDSSTQAPALAGARHLPPHGRVLMVRLSALGDMLFALETVAALHAERPDLRVDFLVEDRFRALLEGHPHLTRILVYPRRRLATWPHHLMELRRERYDVVLDLHGIGKSALHVLLARGRHKIGPAAPAAREGASFAYHAAVPMPTPLPHRADIGHRLLASLGLSGTPHAPLVATVPPPPELFADLPAPRILLHPGTSAFAAFKRWPVGHFAELARQLTARGERVLVGFGPGERELAEPVLQAAPQARAVDGTALGLRGLAGVMQQCAVVVAADTGPLHLAAAVGARCVALFGPKDAARYGPRSHGDRQHAVLAHDVPCRPCTRRRCASPQCVLGIAVDDVLRAVDRALATGAR